MSIFNNFKHLNLSPGQEEALTKLTAFLNGNANVFMLKGYAGSGKTTILKGLVEYLQSRENDYYLMAPTGRAAKVIREKTGQEAFTIHKSIYNYEDLVEVKDGESFYYYYKIKNNIDVINKIFIVDEASMLSDAKSEGEFFRFGTSYLLTDLISFTRINQPMVNSKIIFVGDPCQLPPVSDNSSKAFDANYLMEKFNLVSEETEMKEVQRQGAQSGIIYAAANIRKSITAGSFNSFDLRPNGKDIFNPSYDVFYNTWQHTPSPKIIIANKNKTCLDLNIEIRKRRFGKENMPIQKSDIVIIGRNYYKKDIFNGEFAVVNEVSEMVETKTISLKGKEPVTLIWRDIELIFPDAESSNKIVKGKMLENFLYGENFLTPEETQALYVDFTLRNKTLKPNSEEFKEAIIKDEYFNCLMVKYGYAVTCHKAQGGEWDNVFTIWDNDNTPNFDCLIDQQKRAGKTNKDFYRWAYTAITRASQTLYAINPPYFNSYSNMTFLDTNVVDSLNELTGSTLQTDVIDVDRELIEQLTTLNLLAQPIEIQDHYIKIKHAISGDAIVITSWEKIGYEIRYTFQKENKKTVFRTYVNGKNEFKNSITIMPNLSTDIDFNEQINQLIKQLPNITIRRNTVETIPQQIKFEVDVDEQYPFTTNLYNDLDIALATTGIVIADIEHLQYKKRYTFNRNNEKAVIDFEYNKNHFGRIIPNQNKTNSQNLITDLQTVIQTLKQAEYAS
jgi:tRNA A37 threonylcarbamoyladenosine biosynthesis protein TsaE